jgi:hypothetical protein
MTIARFYFLEGRTKPPKSEAAVVIKMPSTRKKLQNSKPLTENNNNTIITHNIRSETFLARKSNGCPSVLQPVGA